MKNVRFPVRMAGRVLAAGVLALACIPSHATIPGFDTASRSAVASAYFNTYVPLFSVDPGWTGNVATCDEGTTSLAHQQATIDAANFYRVMAGLPQVNLITGTQPSSIEYVAVLRARKAALMMVANGAISQTPDEARFPKCFSAPGVDGAGASILTLGGYGAPGNTAFAAGVTGPGAIQAYVNDAGHGGETGGQLDNRRWILASRARGFATGDIPNTSTPTTINIGFSPGPRFYLAANALRVMPSSGWINDEPAPEPPYLYQGSSAPKWTAWPSPNFVPYQMLPASGYWSVSYPGANFTGASTVTITTAGGTGVPVQVYRLPEMASTDNTLQFIPTLPDPQPGGGMDDTSYKVEVRLNGGTGVPNFCYTVTVFDPAQPGPGDAAPDLCNGGKLAQTVRIGDNRPLFSPGVTLTYFSGATYAPPTAEASSGLPVTFSVSGDCSIAYGPPVMITLGSFTGAGPGICTVIATQEGDATYSAAMAELVVRFIKPAQEVSFPPANPVSADVNSTILMFAAATSTLPVTYGTATSGVCTVDSTSGEVTTGGAAGSCTITADQPGNDQWAQAPQAAYTLAVGGLAAQAITGFDPATPALVGATATLSATGGGAGSPVTFAVDAGSAAVCSTSGTNGATLHFNSAGNCVVNANQAGDATHAAAPQVQRTIAVNKQGQTITFGAQLTPTRTFAPMPGNTFALDPVAYTDAAGLSVVYTSLTPAVCSISGTTVTMNTGGTCTIAADQPGNGTYDAAARKTQRIAIGAAEQTITLTSPVPAPALVGESLALTALSGSGLPVTFAVTTPAICAISGSTVTFGGVGRCGIEASVSGNAGYNAATSALDIDVLAPQNLAITSTPPQRPVTVGGTYTVTAVLTGAYGAGGAVTFSIDPASTPGACSVDAGTGVVTFNASAGTCIVIVQAAGVAGVYAPAQVRQIILLGAPAAGTVAIPTLGEWGLGLLALALVGMAGAGIKRRA